MAFNCPSTGAPTLSVGGRETSYTLVTLANECALKLMWQLLSLLMEPTTRGRFIAPQGETQKKNRLSRRGSAHRTLWSWGGNHRARFSWHLPGTRNTPVNYCKGYLTNCLDKSGGTFGNKERERGRFLARTVRQQQQQQWATALHSVVALYYQSIGS